MNMVYDEPGSLTSGQLFDRLLAASTLVADDMAAGLRERGLTRTRATALWHIAHHQPLSQKRLAELLEVTPRNVTKLLDALERDGFVTRTTDTGDRRSLLITLTPQGQDSADRLQSEAQHLAHELFGDLPADERAALARALARVTTRFSHQAPQA